MLREVPPTAGLPLVWRDFFGARGRPDLAAALAEFVRVREVGVTCSGTAALVVALRALRRRSRRTTVVIPGYTCPLVALAIAHAGLRARACDLAPERFDFDPARLAESCDEDTLAVVPTHLGGLVADLQPVLDIAARSGAFVIEDAAQALGASWHGRPVGTIGDVGFYSLARGKGLTLYEGGFWLARDEELRRAIASEAAALPAASVFELGRIAQLVAYRMFYNPLGLRLTYGVRLRRSLAAGDPVRAVGDDFGPGIPLHRVSRWRRSVGAAALPRLAAAITANARRGRSRAAEVGRIPGFRVVEELPETEGTWPFLMVVARSRALRDRVLARLWTAGLGVSRLFIHELTGYDSLERIVPSTPLPRARSFAEQSFTISNSEHLSEADFDLVRETLARSAEVPDD